MNGAMQGLVPSDAYDIRMTIWDDSGETWGSCSYTQFDISSLRVRLVPPHLVSALEIPAGPTKWFERRLTSADGRAGLAGWLIYVSDNSRYVLAADPTKKQCWFYSGNRVLAAPANP